MSEIVPIRRAVHMFDRHEPGTCNDCKRHGRTLARVSAPGICDTCARDARAESATQRLASAFKSIHPERRWSRTSGDLARCPIGWWRYRINDEVQGGGDSTAALVDTIRTMATHRLVITGAETGVGKTAASVALMQSALDAAHASFVAGNETPIAFAAQARFVAAIDLTDPEVLKQATGASLLVLDDAGQETKCGGFRAEERAGIVADLLDRRERSRRLRTIVTTFGGHEQWGKWYGGRISRLYWEMDSSAVLEMRKAP